MGGILSGARDVDTSLMMRGKEDKYLAYGKTQGGRLLFTVWTTRRYFPESHQISNLITSLPPQGRYVLMALYGSITKLHAVDVAASTIYEGYLNVAKSYGAKELTGRRIADYIWKLGNTGLTISRISSKRYGKERVVRLGVSINIIIRVLERLENG